MTASGKTARDDGALDRDALASGLSGRLVDGVHILPLRIYHEDTDAGGLVYHANYLRYAERARAEMLRLVGIEQSALKREHGVAFAVKRCDLDFRAPARLDDLLEVRSRLTDLRGASIDAEQRILRAGPPLSRAPGAGIDLAVVAVRVACIGGDGRPARLPPLLRHALQSYRQRPLRG